MAEFALCSRFPKLPCSSDFWILRYTVFLSFWIAVCRLTCRDGYDWEGLRHVYMCDAAWCAPSILARASVIASVIRSCGASNTSFIAWRPSFCGCWTTCMEQSIPEFVTDCSSLLTFKKYLKTYLFSLFIRARLDCVKRPCSSLGRLRRYNFVKLHYITLHYITLHYSVAQ